jgi:hypothetical protein
MHAATKISLGRAVSVQSPNANHITVQTRFGGPKREWLRKGPLLRYSSMWVFKIRSGRNKGEGEERTGASNAMGENRSCSCASYHLTASTSRSGLHALALPDLHSWLVVDCCVAHSLLDLARHGKEGLLNVACVLCGGLEEWNAKAVGEFLHFMSAEVIRVRWYIRQDAPGVCRYLPLRLGNRRPSCPSYRSCYRRGAC